jgi:hypothetical protein
MMSCLPCVSGPRPVRQDRREQDPDSYERTNRGQLRHYPSWAGLPVITVKISLGKENDPWEREAYT